MAPIVEGTGVVKRYGALAAVGGVDFTVERGEVFGFLGPNGAGKTSVMRMIQCVSPITSGEITVGGLRAGRDDRGIKALIGVAPQEDSLDQDLSVIDNLVIYARYFGIRRREALSRARELLGFFHLAEKSHTKIMELSGGMRRRLTIARALINNPRLLILDEPTTGLDPQARRVIWRKLESLRNEGVTMLLTTHYMEEAARLCGRVAIMDGGRILLTGAPDRLVESVLGEGVIEAAVPARAVKKAAAALGGMGADFTAVEDVFLVFNADPGRVVPMLEGLEGVRAQVRRPTLEDLFLKVTGRELEGEE